MNTRCDLGQHWPFTSAVFRGLLLSLILVGLCQGALAETPRVLVLATGGTIGSAPSGGQVTGDELVASIPELMGRASVSVETIAAVGSSELKFTDWARLVERIRGAFARDPKLAGIVVTHGTDTMEETAFLLDLVIADPRPVVVTGSMRQSRVTSADGPGNLLEAIMTAADASSRNRGTLVVLDDEIHAAAAVAKTNTTRLSTFKSPDQGPVGYVSPVIGLRYFHSAGRAHRTYALTPSQIAGFPRVDILTSYLGGDDTLLKAALAAGDKGLVIAGFGSGTMTPAVDATADAAAKAGVPVVFSSRVQSGPVHDGSYGEVHRPAAFVMSGLLNPVKARVLLLVHLAAGGENLNQAFEGY
jgi:L-asparaginase